VGVVEEASAVIRRVAFSTIVSVGNDCTAILFDCDGQEIAEPMSYTATTFLGTCPQTMKIFLERYPPPLWRPGDALISNDPWIGAGHMFDIIIATPVFESGTLVAFAMTCGHTPHVGGNGGRIDSRSVFEEGMRIPPMWLYRDGLPVVALMDLLQANVPQPADLFGDIAAQMSAHSVMHRRLGDIMHETRVHDWRPFTAMLTDTCGQAMRAAVRLVPDGVYTYDLRTDDDLLVACCLSVRGDYMTVDYAGTSPQVQSSINSPLIYTRARTFYALKVTLLRNIPNHAATFATIDVAAPDGSILNPSFPAATANRVSVGHFVPSVVMGALAKAIPDDVVAQGAGVVWSLVASGRKEGRMFSYPILLSGGQGASARRAGMDCVSYPANPSNLPVEVVERDCALLIERKELRRDSGGIGNHRGGYGQRITYRVTGNEPVALSLQGDRTRYAAEGLRGGGPGKTGSVVLNGKEVSAKRAFLAQPGDCLDVRTPGGGGYGVPSETVGGDSGVGEPFVAVSDDPHDR